MCAMMWDVGAGNRSLTQAETVVFQAVWMKMGSAAALSCAAGEQSIGRVGSNGHGCVRRNCTVADSEIQSS